MNDQGLRVKCYAGYRGDEVPVQFFIGERSIGVNEVLDRWLDPEHRYFKVRGDDRGIYVLRHDVSTGLWELTLFDSGAAPGGPLSST